MTEQGARSDSADVTIDELSSAHDRVADDELADLDDVVLLSMARRGHPGAFGALFDRYRFPAERFARHLGLRAEAGDVVSESFAQILDLLSRGKGPERAFRAYMYTTIRHEAARRAKARQRVMPTDDHRVLDESVPFGNGGLDGFERDAVRNAYESLPPRWRHVLWAMDVEGRTPIEVGQHHGMSPNATSALAYRARAALRESYLQQHLRATRDIDDAACVASKQEMASMVRGTASKRVRTKVLEHMGSCEGCASDHRELSDINGEIGTIGVSVAGGAGAVSALLSFLPAIKAALASVLVPAVAVGAVAVAPVIVLRDAPVSNSAQQDVARIAVKPVDGARSGDDVRTVRVAFVDSTKKTRAKTKTSVSPASPARDISAARVLPPARAGLPTVLTVAPAKRIVKHTEQAVSGVVDTVLESAPVPEEIAKPVSGLLDQVSPSDE